jgi:ABC-type nitrate/sulfonate/bicarbonate transport system substrate-binding protein
MHRRFLSLIALVALFLYPVHLAAQQRVKVAYASISPNFAGLWVAKESGAFEKHGVAADLIYIASGALPCRR